MSTDSNYQPKISILSPSYNHGKFIKSYIQSVLNQTMQEWELIIVDDNSTDNNVEEIKKFDDERIILIQHDYNKGINAGLNSAFARARGKYVVFMASDDMFAANHLETTSKYLDENPDCDVFYCSLNQIDENDNPIEERTDAYVLKKWDKSEYLSRAFKKGNSLTSPGMMMRREAFERVYPLDLSVVQYQDYAMHIKLLIKGNIFISTEKLVNYRILASQTNISAKSSVVITREKMETDKLMDSFLLIEDVELLKKIFGSDLDEFGTPVRETIPYFLARFALKCPDYERKAWGYKKVMDFVSKQENFELLQKLYGFDFKEYIGLAKSFDGVSNDIIASMDRKAARYKKMFNVLLVVSIVLGAVLSSFILLFFMFK